MSAIISCCKGITAIRKETECEASIRVERTTDRGECFNGGPQQAKVSHAEVPHYRKKQASGRGEKTWRTKGSKTHLHAGGTTLGEEQRVLVVGKGKSEGTKGNLRKALNGPFEKEKKWNSGSGAQKRSGPKTLTLLGRREYPSIGELKEGKRCA